MTSTCGKVEIADRRNICRYTVPPVFGQQKNEINYKLASKLDKHSIFFLIFLP